MTVPLRFEYDPASDVLTVEGVKYAGELFRGFGILPADTWIRIVGRADGVVVLSSATPHAAILAAESAAYERAAKECDAYANEMAAKPMDLTAKVAAQCTAGACANRVRSLATKGGDK